MMAISGLELGAGVAWALGAAAVVWGWRARRLEAPVAVLLIAVMTIIAIVGPVAGIVFLVKRRSTLTS